MRGLFGNHPVPHVDDLVIRTRKYLPGMWLVGLALAALYSLFFLSSNSHTTPLSWLIAIVIFVVCAIFSRWFCRWCARRVTTALWIHHPFQLFALHVLPEYVALLALPAIVAIVDPIRLFNSGVFAFPLIMFPVPLGLTAATQRFSVDDSPSCANCGYPRPAEQDDPKGVCPECGNAWWLEGRFTKGRIVRRTRWASMFTVVLVLLCIIPFLISMKSSPVSRGVLRLAPTSAIVTSLENRSSTFNDRAWRELSHRTLTTDQVHRLVSSLMPSWTASTKDYDAGTGFTYLLQQPALSDDDLRAIVSTAIPLTVKVAPDPNAPLQNCMEIHYTQSKQLRISDPLNNIEILFYVGFPIDDLGSQSNRVLHRWRGNKITDAMIDGYREVCNVAAEHIPDTLHIPVLVAAVPSAGYNQATVNSDGSLTPPAGTTWSRTIIIEKSFTSMGPPTN